MSAVSSNYQVCFSRLLIIMIIMLMLYGCASHQPAPVTDRSKSLIHRPATHIVIPGDTLFSIAWRYGLKYEALAKHNGIAAPYIIRPSQVIRLDVGGTPAPKTNGTSSSQRLASGPKAVISSKANTGGGKAAPPKAAPRKENNTAAAAKTKPNPVASGALHWGWPVKGAVLSGFQGNGGLNKGIDLAGKLGEPVLAAASGQVVYSGSGLRGYGKLLIVKHNENFLSAYAHNDRLLVKEGDFVKAGQRIADMGSSGTDRVKLHFEIRRDGTPVDPLKYLPRR
jgi:lipoprotein NlpD